MIILFFHLDDLHAYVHFGRVDYLAVLIIVGTSIIDGFVDRILPLQRCIVHTFSHLVVAV